MAQDLSSPIEEIKERLDIVDIVRGYLNLQKAGSNYKANCPFHNEKTPSFFVSPDRQMFKCFGCGEGGDVLTFVQKMEGLEFRDVLRLLADKAGVQLKKQDPQLASERARLLEVCQLSSKFFQKQLQSKVGQAVYQYLTVERGIKPEIIKQFQLGWVPNQWRSLSDFLIGQGYTVDEIVKAGLAIAKNKIETGRDLSLQKSYYDRFRARIMFPIADLQGNIVGFTGRVLTEKIAQKFGIDVPKDMGKYINTPETLIYHKSKLLYGLDKAKTEIRKQQAALLVEGNADVILCHQAGFQNAIACSGTALTDYQLQILGRYTKNLVLGFDMDAAGQLATRRSIEMAMQQGFAIKIIDMPPNQDPAQMIQDSLSAWQKNISQAQGILDFYFQKTFANFKPKDLDHKKQAAVVLLPWIKRLANKIEQAHWLQQLSQRLNIEEVVLRQEMAKTKIFNVETHGHASLQKTVKTAEAYSQNNNFVKLTNSLLSLLILRPQNLTLFKQDNFFKKQFLELLDLQARQIVTRLKKIDYKKINDYQSLKENFPKELSNHLEKLAFEAECQYFSDEDFDYQAEIQFCCQQIKDIYFKRKLNHLNMQIKQAELNQDQSKLKKLLKTFNKVSQEITI